MANARGSARRGFRPLPRRTPCAVSVISSRETLTLTASTGPKTVKRARVLLEDEPIAFVDSGEKRGFHINIAVECPWGHVFDAELHERLFEVPS